MVVTTKFIEENYPLHNLVWQNRAADLDALIKNSPVPLDLEKLDPRGRTPLFLATSLSSYDTALVLLKHNANTSFEHSNGWTVVHEAVCSGNPELLGVILKYRDHQRRAKRSDLIPKLLQRLKDTPDFFFEMKWEFTSWIPLMTRMCPANTHRVYKMGSYLRVDSTDNGVEDPSTSSKGAISVIFQGREEGVKMMEIDHSSSQVYSSMILAGNDKSSIVPDVSVYEKSISQRLGAPAIISFVNLEKIAFERNKTGIWGWGSDKSERINNYDCKVFAATNVELVTRMRYEHLTEADKTRSTSMSNLQKVLNTFGSEEVTETQGAAAAPTKASASVPPTDLQKAPAAAAAAAITPTSDSVDLYKNITAQEYFDADHDLQGADIGRPREIKTKINKFKATGWLCEEYPLNLQEQLMPIVDIMALSSSQFSKLKDFIQMQMPAGFPIKIEIPLFHLVNACITFHNIFSTEEPVPGVSHLTEESGRLSCIVDEQLFEPPPHYTVRSASNFGPITSSSDDDIFQWTSTDETAETMDIYQALNAPRTLIKDISPESDAEEQLLQRAIEESLKAAHQLGQLNVGNNVSAAAAIDDGDSRTRSDVMITRSDSMEQLQRVLDMSRQEIEDEARLRREEEEALRRVLELSLHDK